MIYIESYYKNQFGVMQFKTLGKFPIFDNIADDFFKSLSISDGIRIEVWDSDNAELIAVKENKH